MRQLICAVLLMAATSSTFAQAVYRCVQKGKPVSYQTDPCPKGAQISAIREFTPDYQPTPAELAQRRRKIEAEMAVRHHNERVLAAQAPRVTVVQNRSEGPSCSRAKAERDAWERQVGLSRTIDGLRAWQEYVEKACR